MLGRTGQGYADAILNVRDYPTYAPLRVALGQTRRFAERMDLNSRLAAQRVRLVPLLTG